jgi:uncharacterized protein (TIGR02145 family)
MAENLRTTKYNDGITDIIDGNIDAVWKANTTGAYCDYDNNKNLSAVYGLLYNWYAVKAKLAPAGWHVPTVEDFKTLDKYLGEGITAGRALREKGTVHWSPNDDYTTNSSGFTGLPGGARLIVNGQPVLYGNLHTVCYFWTSDENSDFTAKCLQITPDLLGPIIYNDSYKSNGYSIRLIKDPN